MNSLSRSEPIRSPTFRFTFKRLAPFHLGVAATSNQLRSSSSQFASILTRTEVPFLPFPYKSGVKYSPATRGPRPHYCHISLISLVAGAFLAICTSFKACGFRYGNAVQPPNSASRVYEVISIPHFRNSFPCSSILSIRLCVQFPILFHLLLLDCVKQQE